MTIFMINCDECRFHVDSLQCCVALPEEVPYKGVCVGLGFTCSPKCFITIKTSFIADGIFDRVLLALHIFSPSKPCCVYRIENNETNDLGWYCTKSTVVLNSLYVPGSTAKVVYFVYSLRHIIGLIATKCTN
jgi:hypothetical protein